MVKGTGPKLVKQETITLDPDLRQGLAKVFRMNIGKIPKTLDLPSTKKMSKKKGGTVKAKKMMGGGKAMAKKKMMGGVKAMAKKKMMYGGMAKKK